MAKEMNVYKKDNKYYVWRISYYSFDKLIGDTYLIDLRIKMRGYNKYTYTKGTDYITRAYPFPGERKRILYLESDSLNTILSLINKIDNIIEEAKGKLTTSGNISIYYNNKHDGRADLLVIYNDRNEYQFKENCVLHYMVLSGSIDENPIYMRALSENDINLILKLRIQYNVATNEECESVGALPKSSLDKYLYVYSDSIDRELLSLSGYRILHRACMAMRGSTREIWSLNPYKKEGVDAAPENSNAISFIEYINLIRENKL